jgi:hypothetical protein
MSMSPGAFNRRRTQHAPSSFNIERFKRERGRATRGVHPVAREATAAERYADDAGIVRDQGKRHRVGDAELTGHVAPLIGRHRP